MLARSTAARTAIAPSSGAVKLLKAPEILPMGVRAAERMTASCFELLLLMVDSLENGMQIVCCRQRR